MRNWTDREDAMLARLWVAEGLSARLCGLELGRSKSACLARTKRLGLPPHPTPIKASSPPAPASSEPEHLPPAAAEPLPGERPVAFSLPSPVRTCQWTDSDGRPWVFCDAAVAPGFAYCERHCRRAFTVWPWRRAA